jgi:hypothetical protein
MVLVIGHWPVIKENQVRLQIIPYVNCDGQSGIAMGFSPCTSVSSLNIITPLYFHTFIDILSTLCNLSIVASINKILSLSLSLSVAQIYWCTDTFLDFL